jgi:hypothetical protein
MRGSTTSCSYQENTSRITELIADIQAGRSESAEALRQLLRPGAEFLLAHRLAKSPVDVAAEVLVAAIGEVLARRANTAMDLTRFTAYQIRHRTETSTPAIANGRLARRVLQAPDKITNGQRERRSPLPAN